MRWLGYALVLVLVSVLPVASQHGSWHDRYSGANGISCCGPRDCVVTKARLLSQTAETSEVEVDMVAYAIPTRSVHQSEDMQDWVCWGLPVNGEPRIRCLFIAAGG